MIGPLFNEKSRLRSAVRKRVRWCAARDEHLRHQRREKLFINRENRRFAIP